MIAFLTLAIAAHVGNDATRPLSTLYLREADSTITWVSADETDPHWWLVTPLARDYDNFRLCHPKRRPDCHQPIEYSVREIEALRGRSSFLLSEVPELSKAGTHRLQVVSGSRPLTDVTERLVEALPQIVVRRGDDYVGHLTELFGVPFVLWPQKLVAGHQTDRRLGADCSALVVYGQRRLGRHVRYVAPRGLFRLTRELKPDEALKAGDVLNYGFQSAVLSVDTPPLGRLNDGDLIIQTYHGVAEELPLSALPYRDAAVRVLRWP